MSHEYDFSIGVRQMFPDERQRHGAWGTDAAVVVEIDGQPVFWTDDYMTIHYIEGNTPPSFFEVEKFMEAVGDMYAHYTRGTDAREPRTD